MTSSNKNKCSIYVLNYTNKRSIWQVNYIEKRVFKIITSTCLLISDRQTKNTPLGGVFSVRV